MEIKVNEQSQRFYLAFDEWVPAVGHEIKVGKYRFCAIPLSKSINISEVTSGVHAISIPIDSRIWMATSTKEDTMSFLAKAGEGLKRILEKQSNLEELLEKNKMIAFERLGEMPPIEDVDTDWITAHPCMYMVFLHCLLKGDNINVEKKLLGTIK